MAEYVFRDEERTIKVDPVEALGERGKRDHYFCPNPNCNALLRVVRNDDRHKNPFFRAMPSHPHIESCNYKAYYDADAQKEKIQQTNSGLHDYDFRIETLFERVTSDLGKDIIECTERRGVKEKTDYKRESLIGSTEKLARLCLSYDTGDMLGDSQIIDFLIDSRTAYERYSKYINVENGNKVFLLILPLAKMNYNSEKARINLYLNEQFRDKPGIDYWFEINFTSLDVFRSVLKPLYDFKGTKSEVAILTKMQKNYGEDDHYVCSIFSERQVWVKIDNSMAQSGIS